MLDPIYFQFTEKQLMSHFVSVRKNGKCSKSIEQLEYYKKSIKRCKDYLALNSERKRKPLSELKWPCQIEKDERFWIARALMTLFYSPDRVEELVRVFRIAFGDSPPIDFSSWQDCLKGELCLFFEPNLPSPRLYKEWLHENISKRQPIPYVLDSAVGKVNLEGPTHVDAILLNPDNGFALIIEAKVLSDISVQISYDVLRNQIARNIDVMLENNDSLCSPLNLRKPENTLFLLVTPEIFKDNPSTRLYGYKMIDYKTNPNLIGEDLPHRSSNWNEISKRLGWITYRDLGLNSTLENTENNPENSFL